MGRKQVMSKFTILPLSHITNPSTSCTKGTSPPRRSQFKVRLFAKIHEAQRTANSTGASTLHSKWQRRETCTLYIAPGFSMELLPLCFSFKRQCTEHAASVDEDCDKNFS